MNKITDNKTDNNILNKKPKKLDKDSIPMRIEFIKNLLYNKDLEPLVNFDSTETENFIGLRGGDDESGDSYDTRIVLKKRIHDFKNIINQIGGKLKYIKSGTTGHTFKGIASDNHGSFDYAVKVVAYPKKERYGDINDVRRPENAELMMIKLLSYFVVNKQTPHLVIPFGTFNTSIETFVNLVKLDKIDEKNERYKEFVERYKNGEFSSTVSILISEWANKGDFLDYLKNNYKSITPVQWKVFMFQIISTLAIIQSKYPSFRHNDMKANNILLHQINSTTLHYYYYVVRTKYKVPNIGFHVKLWDFDFACIPGIVDNIKVSSKWTKKINVTPEQNRYYDIHYFFNTLIRKGFFPQILTDPIIPHELKEFIGRILPQKYRDDSNYIHEKGRILVNDEFITPDEILKKDPYFEDFRINKSLSEACSKPLTRVHKDIKNIDDDIYEQSSNFKSVINKFNIDKLIYSNKEINQINNKNISKKPSTKKNIDIIKLLGDINNNKINLLEENSDRLITHNSNILDVINDDLRRFNVVKA
jgi:hypothetical protein